MSIERRPGTAGLALAMALSACASAQGAGAPLPDALAAGWQGAAVCELLREDERARVLVCTFPPGVGHERHVHPRHYGYVLQGGTMRVTDADGAREQATAAGTSWASAGVAWHEAVNVGETTTRYLIIEMKGED